MRFAMKKKTRYRARYRFTLQRHYIYAKVNSAFFKARFYVIISTSIKDILNIYKHIYVIYIYVTNFIRGSFYGLISSTYITYTIYTDNDKS